MSLPPRTEDPTFNRYIANQLASRFDGAINHVQGTAEANPDDDELLDDLLGWLALVMMDEVMKYVEMSMRRGVTFAVTMMNRNPQFHVRSDLFERWPTDDALKSELREEITSIVENVANDIRQGNYTKARLRADQLARTETMHSLNESARRRYRAWGIKRYRFFAHLGCCNEPKTLSDGTVVAGGCEELHNQTFPIDDEVHRPPIHPLGRCTLLPVFE